MGKNKTKTKTKSKIKIKRNVVKTLLSWDVGIKNLAYAIIAFYDDDSMKIRDMGVIDTVDFRKMCHHIKRDGDTCPHVAQTVFKIKEKDRAEKYYCNTHIKKVDYEIVDPGTDVKCCKCKKFCHKIVEGTDYGWCEKHMTTNVDIYKRRCVKNFMQHCNKQSLSKIGNSMFTKLDNHRSIEKMLDVDQVLIELQPVKKNANMKSVAMELFSYFVIRGITEKKGKYCDNIEAGVRTVNASGKLKVDRKTTDDQLEKAKKKKKNSKDRIVYNITKKLGIIYATHLMTKKDIKKLNNYKKQDDVCDAVLQAISNYFGFELPNHMKDQLEKAHMAVLKLEKEEADKKRLREEKKAETNKGKGKKKAKRKRKSKAKPKKKTIVLDIGDRLNSKKKTKVKK